MNKGFQHMARKYEDGGAAMQRPLFRNMGGPAAPMPQDMAMQAPPPMAAPPMPAGPEQELMAVEQSMEGVGRNYVESMVGGIDAAEDVTSMINALRGNEAPLEARYAELAGYVGEADASQTPESVLAMVQPTILMTEEGAVDSGIGQLMQGIAGSDMETPAGDPTAMGQGVGELMAMGAGNTPPVNFRHGGEVQHFFKGGSPDPRAQELFNQDRALYGQLIGSGDQKADFEEQKRLSQAQVFFDIAQAALAAGAPTATPMSAAERLAQAAQPLLGNVSARSGDLLKFKQAQKAEKRQLDLAALQSSQGKLGVEKQAEIDAAAAFELSKSKKLENAAKNAQELLLQSNKFSFERAEGETEQSYALRLAKDLAESRRTLANLQGTLTKDQIELRDKLAAQEARLTEAHDISLQSKKFDFTTKERVSSQKFKNELQNAIDTATASRQALSFKNDEKSITQRGEIDKELARLRSELRVTEKAVDLEGMMKVAGVKNRYELNRMDKGQAFDIALADHRSVINSSAALNQQLATATENALDRAARENLQITAQNFRTLLQNDMQDFTGSESEKDRLLTKLQNDVLNGLKERGVDISQGNLDLAVVTQVANESMAVRKQAFAEANAAANRLQSIKEIELRAGLDMAKLDATAENAQELAQFNFNLSEIAREDTQGFTAAQNALNRMVTRGEGAKNRTSAELRSELDRELRQSINDSNLTDAEKGRALQNAQFQINAAFKTHEALQGDEKLTLDKLTLDLKEKYQLGMLAVSEKEAEARAKLNDIFGAGKDGKVASIVSDQALLDKYATGTLDKAVDGYSDSEVNSAFLMYTAPQQSSYNAATKTRSAIPGNRLTPEMEAAIKARRSNGLTVPEGLALETPAPESSVNVMNKASRLTPYPNALKGKPFGSKAFFKSLLNIGVEAISLGTFAPFSDTSGGIVAVKNLNQEFETLFLYAQDLRDSVFQGKKLEDLTPDPAKFWLPGPDKAKKMSETLVQRLDRAIELQIEFIEAEEIALKETGTGSISEKRQLLPKLQQLRDGYAVLSGLVNASGVMGGPETALAKEQRNLGNKLDILRGVTNNGE